MEELLGVKAIDPGFAKVEIRPELAGLKWIRGAVATPRGPVRVSADERHIEVEIPAGTEAVMLLPAGNWSQNGAHIRTKPVESGTRLRTVLRQAGTYDFVMQ